MESYRRRRAIGLTGTIILFIIVWCGVSACSPDKLYYADSSDPLNAITDTFGSPQWVEVQPDGAEKLVYRVRDPMGGNDYYRYFIIKNGKVIGGGIK